MSMKGIFIIFLVFLIFLEVSLVSSTSDAPLTADEHTKILLHFDGGNGSTNFTDEMGAIWIPVNGTVQNETYMSEGVSSAYLNGTQYIETTNTSWYPGTGNFTVEWAMKLNSLGKVQTIFANSPATCSSGERSIHIYIDSDNALKLTLGNGTNYTLVSSTSVIPDTEWHQYAVQRAGTNATLFIDGITVGSGDVGNINATVTSTDWAIGRTGAYSGYYLDGYIDEFIYTKGVAKFVSTVKVPTYYYAYGDSITRATGYTDLNMSGDDCYIMQMVSRHYNNTRTASHNIDGGGQTSEWGLSNFGSHFTQGTSVVVIEFGVNDLAKDVTAEACAANLVRMHDYTVSNESTCIVIVQTLMTDNDLSYRDLPAQREYIRVIEAALDAAGVQYIRGYDTVDTTPGNAVPDSPDLSFYASDGVHLNVAGQALLGDALC